MEGSGVAFPERVDRLLGEYGVQADTPAGRRHFMEATEARRQSQRGLGKQRDLFWRKWRFGADDFAELLASKLGRRGEPDESPPAREELDAVRAERLVREALKSEGCLRGQIRWRSNKAQHFLGEAFTAAGIEEGTEEDLSRQPLHFTHDLPEAPLVGHGFLEGLILGPTQGDGDRLASDFAPPLIATARKL